MADGAVRKTYYGRKPDGKFLRKYEWPVATPRTHSTMQVYACGRWWTIAPWSPRAH